MPRLVLYDDDGNTLFDAPVSQSNVNAIAGFLRRNMGALQAAAAFKRAVGTFGELLGLAPELERLRRPPAPPRPPRVKGRRS